MIISTYLKLMGRATNQQFFRSADVVVADVMVHVKYLLWIGLCSMLQVPLSASAKKHLSSFLPLHAQVVPTACIFLCLVS